jgi:hypothetical protein
VSANGLELGYIDLSAFAGRLYDARPLCGETFCPPQGRFGRQVNLVTADDKTVVRAQPCGNRRASRDPFLENLSSAILFIIIEPIWNRKSSAGCIFQHYYCVFRKGACDMFIYDNSF